MERIEICILWWATLIDDIRIPYGILLSFDDDSIFFEDIACRFYRWLDYILEIYFISLFHFDRQISTLYLSTFHYCSTCFILLGDIACYIVSIEHFFRCPICIGYPACLDIFWDISFHCHRVLEHFEVANWLSVDSFETISVSPCISVASFYRVFFIDNI